MSDYDLRNYSRDKIESISLNTYRSVTSAHTLLYPKLPNFRKKHEIKENIFK